MTCQGIQSNACISVTASAPLLLYHTCVVVRLFHQVLCGDPEACSVSRQATFPLTQEVPLE